MFNVASSLPRKLDFTDWYQLGLNKNRVLLMQAMSHAWGAAIAGGTDDIDLEFFLVVCDTEEEAREMQSEANALRKLARIEAKRKH